MTDAELATLYSRYGHLVLRRCTRLVGPSDADDAMHDVFLKVSTAAPPQGSTLVWLYRVTTNACYDRLRRQRRDTQQREALRAPPPGEVAADADQRALLGLVLRRVDPEVCALGLLHHLDGLTQEEIADEVGLSRKTVGRKLQRFQQEFASQWQQAGGT